MKNRNSELMEMLEYLELFALEERFKAICDSPKFSLLILFNSFRNLLLQNMITEKKTIWTDFLGSADLERILHLLQILNLAMAKFAMKM